jgi:hypothetical protein
MELTRRILHNQEQHDTCCNATLSLRVKDSTVADGGWLTGVQVTIVKNNTTIATGTTNSEGRYTRNELCGNSTYTVTFSKDGFHSKTVTFTYTSCSTVNETIGLTPN